MSGRHGDMAMGSADVTQADEDEGAEVVQGEFRLLDSAPEGGDKIACADLG